MKRILDLLLTLAAAPVWVPAAAIVALLVRIRMGSPVLFTQLRPGLNAAPFKLFKFRTMLNETESDGSVLTDGERLTSFGRWLRASSLDELPELWNVLRGDMSLVGPRPLLQEYVALYSREQSRRHEVRPGITGWAQINGRNATTWEDRLRLDVWYVDNRSFWLDLKIILFTIVRVLRREGVSQHGEATMSRFGGASNPGSRNG